MLLFENNFCKRLSVHLARHCHTKQHTYASERNCRVEGWYGLSCTSWTSLDAEAVKVRFLEEHVRNGIHRPPWGSTWERPWRKGYCSLLTSPPLFWGMIRSENGCSGRMQTFSHLMGNWSICGWWKQKHANTSRRLKMKQKTRNRCRWAYSRYWIKDSFLALPLQYPSHFLYQNLWTDAQAHASIPPPPDTH